MIAVPFLLITVHVAWCAPPRPHVVFALIDDLGWNDVGFHGASEIRTPNIDSLVNSGLRLDNYYVQLLCTPTRASLVTGRYPIRYGLQHGVLEPDDTFGLPLNETTIAQEFKKNGYATHMIGKWHLGFANPAYTPTARGFDTFIGYFNGGETYDSHLLYTYNCTDDNSEYIIQTGRDFRNGTATCPEVNGIYSTYIYNDAAVNVIEKHNPNTSLFLYLPLQAVHEPLQAPEQYKEPYLYINNTPRATVCGMVSAMDELIGNVTNALLRTGLWKDTIFVFSTDNGGFIQYFGNNWPLRGGKLTNWEGGVRGTAFINGGVPGLRRGVSTDLMHVTDWLPTLLSATGSARVGTFPLDGYDMWPTFTKNVPSPRTVILHQVDPVGCTAPNQVCGAIRKGDWKLIVGNEEMLFYPTWAELPEGMWVVPTANITQNIVCGGPSPNLTVKDCPFQSNQPCLFNIRNDPCEYKDVAAQNPSIVSDLMSLLTDYAKQAVTPHQQNKDYPADCKGADPQNFNGWWSPWL